MAGSRHSPTSGLYHTRSRTLEVTICEAAQGPVTSVVPQHPWRNFTTVGFRFGLTIASHLWQQVCSSTDSLEFRSDRTLLTGGDDDDADHER